MATRNHITKNAPLAVFVLLVLGPFVTLAVLEWGSTSPLGTHCRPVATPDLFAVPGTLAAQIYDKRVAGLAPCIS